MALSRRDSFLPLLSIHLPRYLLEPPLLSSPQYLSSSRVFKNRKSSWFIGEQDSVFCPEGCERTFSPFTVSTSPQTSASEIWALGGFIRAAEHSLRARDFLCISSFYCLEAVTPNPAADVEAWGWIQVQGWSQHCWLHSRAAGAWAWRIQAGHRHRRICFSSLDFLQIWSVFSLLQTKSTLISS